MTSIFARPKPPAAIVPTSREYTARTKARVMIVDDHPLVRRGLAALVNAEPDMASCGELESAVIAMAEVARCRPEVVVIDASMHQGEGLQLIQRIKAFDSRIRIVALAMSDKPENVARIFSAGAAACVTRIDLATRVLQAIRRTCTVKAHSEPGTAARGTRPASHRPRSAGKQLDDVEREIVELIGCGLPARSIAVRLHLSVRAVEAYRRRIRGKLNFPTATQLVQFCVRWVERNRGTGAPADSRAGGSLAFL